MIFFGHPKPKFGWTREYDQYLDLLRTTDVSYCATWKQRSRHGNRLALGVNDGPHLGPVRERDDFPETTRRLAALQRERGRVNVYMPKEERERQRPFDAVALPQLEIPLVTCIILIFNTVVGVSTVA